MYDKTVFFIRFVCFLFLPLEDYEDCNGIFYLHAWEPDKERYVTSSAIRDIHRNGDYVVLETRDGLYKFDGPVNISCLDKVMRYLKDDEYTTQQFYNECKLRIQKSKRGWRIF